MNALQKGLTGSIACLVLVIGVAITPQGFVHAQMDMSYSDSGSCDMCGGFSSIDSGTASYPADTGNYSSIDSGTASYPADTGNYSSIDSGTASYPADSGNYSSIDSGTASYPVDSGGNYSSVDSGTATYPFDNGGNYSSIDSGTALYPDYGNYSSIDSGTALYPDYGNYSSIDSGTALYPADSSGNYSSIDSGTALYPADSSGNYSSIDSGTALYPASSYSNPNYSSNYGYTASPVLYSGSSGYGYTSSGTGYSNPGYGYVSTPVVTTVARPTTTVVQTPIAIATPVTNYSCPSGYSGTYPNCVAPKCPTNYTGTYPNCVAPVQQYCPSGYSGTYPNCVAPVCPSGYSGIYPNCTAPVQYCPTGTYGTYPNCITPNNYCPSGYTGTPPNCTAPVQYCPAGYTGTYPNCVAPTYSCPTGYTGTYPNCVAPTLTCPTGTTGTFPSCTYTVTGTGGSTPIVINNNNTNTNTNSAPVTQAVTVPAQQTIAYAPQPIYYNPNPVSCTITASPSVIQNGQATTLSWSSNGATTAVLNDGIGSLSTNGSLQARPSQTVLYVLTVYGQGTSSTCNVMVTVSGSSISLTQIPYTGFDFGPVGDAIYWAGLLAFAVAAAYLLVYYRGGAFTLATAMVTGRSMNEFKPVKFTDKELDSATIFEKPVASFARPTVTHVAHATQETANPRLAPVAFNLPVAEVRRATTDSMIVNHSTNGEAPRIIITRA